jgi:hypothetical protein
MWTITHDSSYRSTSLPEAVIDVLCFAPATRLAAPGTADGVLPTEEGVPC